MQWKALIAACARSSRPAAASRPTRRRSNCSSWQSGTPAFTGTSRLNGRLQSGSLPFCSAIVLSPQRAEGSKRWSAARHTQRSGHSRAFETVFLVALEDLVAGLARNAEHAADLAHRFAVQQPSDEPQALVHHRTLLPRHPRLPGKGGRCYPCVRYDLSPMSRAAHTANRTFGRTLPG